MVPLTATVGGLWLRWRWLRLKRRFFGEERMRGATRRFHEFAAEAMVRRAILQQGLIIKTCQFLGSRADILMEEYVRTLPLLPDAVPPRPWEAMRATNAREPRRTLEHRYAHCAPQPVPAAPPSPHRSPL